MRKDKEQEYNCYEESLKYLDLFFHAVIFGNVKMQNVKMLLSEKGNIKVFKEIL